MNSHICSHINELVLSYRNNKNESTLDEIEYLLKLLEYESWQLKYDLKLIEHPDKFRMMKNIEHFDSLFSYENAYSKYHLILPLLMYLLVNHNSHQSALETSLHFMESSQEFLKPGDFAKTKTGAQRFITNTRFASLELRNLGLLRSDSKRFYKYWELSLFGIIIAGNIYLDFKQKLATAFYRNFSWYKAKGSTNKILQHYGLISRDPDNFKLILNLLLKEELVSNYFKLYNQKFICFIDQISKVLEEGYNNRKKSTNDLILSLDSINSDSEISKLANAIILRKDIEVNLSDVYSILNIDRKK